MYKFLLVLIFIASYCSAFEPYSIRASLEHIEGSGIGYRRGYTTLDGFIMGRDSCCYPFLNIRGHGFNNRRMAANFGGGIRCLSDCDWIFGANFWYDLRQGDHRGFNRVGRCYHQFGFGLEAFGPVLDFRFNFYQPVGKKAWRFTQIHFNDNAGITPIFSFKKQLTFTGLDAEVGGYIGCGSFCNCLDWSVYLALGTYMIKEYRKNEDFGINARLKADLTEYWTLEVRAGYDQHYLGSMQVKVAFHFPLYPKSSLRQEHCFPDYFRKEITQPVERLLEIMPLRTKKLFLL